MIGAAKGYRVKLCLPANASHGAQADSEGLRRGDGFHRSRPKAPTAPSACAARSTRPIRTLFLSGSVQQSGQLEGAFRRHRPRDHGADRRAHHAFRGGAWAPAERSWASRGGCSATCRDVKCYSAQPSSGFHGLEGLEAHADRHRAGHLRRRRWPTTTSGSKPRTPTHDAPAGAARKGCWWASRPARNVLAAREVGKRTGGAKASRGVIVTMLCDGADKYLSEHFWDEE